MNYFALLAGEGLVDAVGQQTRLVERCERIFLIGVAIYGVGTLVAVVSWNVTVLAFGWSLLEGVGAALILPLAFALLVTNYDAKTQAIGFGILGGAQASAAAVDPILGGILTTYASWRWALRWKSLLL